MESIILQNSLGPDFYGPLKDLIEDCRQADGWAPSFPEDGDVYLFLANNNGGKSPLFLTAALVLFSAEEDLWEACAFTRPSYRREGRFRRLLDAAEDFAPQAQFSFALSSKDNSGNPLAALKAIGADYWYSEHAMALDAPEDPHLWGPGKDFGLSGGRLVWPGGNEIQPESHLDACFYQEEILTASCSLAFFSGNAGLSCCIYQVLVPEPLRNQGWGSRFLSALLPCLFRRGVRRILLQVSGNNLPALALYQKTGFRITETLSYYLY